MDESVLRDFFLGKVSGAQLAADVSGSTTHPESKVSVVHIRDMEEPFTVTRPMAVALCDAALEGSLPADALETVGFALMASDCFEWDDDLLANMFSGWACPEINYPLTGENIEMFKRWLLELEPLPPTPVGEEYVPNPDDIISVTHKKSVGPGRVEGRRPDKPRSG
jgi:hypothetical protein